jgi:hypothetical protein
MLAPTWEFGARSCAAAALPQTTTTRTNPSEGNANRLLAHFAFMKSPR